MTVRVLFFAALRERVGCREVERTLATGATVDDLWQALCVEHPGLRELTSSIAFAVNRDYVERSHRLSDHDEVAVIPPVSGGIDVRDR